MKASEKSAALRSFSIAAAAAIAVAAGLPSLRFAPGAPLPEPDAGVEALARPAGPAGASLAGGKLMLAAIIALLAAIVLIASFRKIMGLRWKGVLAFLGKSFGLVAGVSLLCLILFSVLPPGPVSAPPPVERLPSSPSLGEARVPSPPPAVLAWIAAALSAGLAAALVLRLASGRRGVPPSRDPIELEAEAARMALLGGAELRGAILDCYRRMSRALERERGIERGESTTAREFEALLAGRGLPEGSVRRLTALFESARYGDLGPSPGDEAEALACLEDIERGARASRGEGRS